MEQKNIGKLYLIYILLAASLFVGIESAPLRGEESRRFIMAMEMVFSGDFFNPTVLGEEYFNKPPLFGWVVGLFFYIFGYNEISLRLVSVISSLISSFISVFMSYIITKDRAIALLSGLIFLSFLDVAFWYGSLGEIDMFFTLIVNLCVLLFLIFLTKGKIFYGVLSGIFLGLGFLTKGFPAFVFFTVFVFVAAITYRSMEIFKRLTLGISLSLLFAGFIILVWILNLKNPEAYLLTLYKESFSRVATEFNLSTILLKKIEFLLTLIKMTLPVSGIILILVLFRRSSLIFKKNEYFTVVSLWVLVTFFIFLFFTNSAGRYLLPIFPLTAAVISYTFFNDRKGLIKRFSYFFVFIAIFRIIVGFTYPSLYTKYKGDLKTQAIEVKRIVKSSSITCDCHSKYEVCAYLDIVFERPIFSSKRIPNYDYRVSCEEENTTPFREYTFGNKKFYLYKNF